jgi:hypothetical protein
VSAAEIILATGTAPTDPASGKVSLYSKTDDKLYYRDSSGVETEMGGGGVYLWRNALLNGSFAIWQRQSDPATATEYADDEYCADRWYVLTQSNPIDAERIDGDTQRYAARLTQKQATAQQIGLAQIIEGANCRHLRGQEVTFSVRTQCSAAETINIAVLEWGGTEDSVTSDVAASWSGSGLPTLATSVTQAGSTGQTALSVSTWADVSTTVTLGSSFTNLIIFVWTDTTLSQNTTLDLEAAQLERGATATPFEVRPVGAELALCQRYFQLAPLPERALGFRSAISGSTNYIRGQGFALGVPMRAVPTVTDNNPTWATTNPVTNNEVAFYNDNAAAYTTITSGIFDGVMVQPRADALSFYLQADAFSGSGGDLGLVFFGGAVELYLDAEI